MVEYFRRRAIGAAVVTGVVAFAGIFVLHADADYLFDGLTSRALPLVIISAIVRRRLAGAAAARQPRGARLLAIGAVAAVVIGWGVAQWPYLLPESLTVDRRRRARRDALVVLVVFVVAAVVILPSLGLLYFLDQRSLLETDTGPDDQPAAASTPVAVVATRSVITQTSSCESAASRATSASPTSSPSPTSDSTLHSRSSPTPIGSARRSTRPSVKATRTSPGSRWSSTSSAPSIPPPSGGRVWAATNSQRPSRQSTVGMWPAVRDPQPARLGVVRAEPARREVVVELAVDEVEDVAEPLAVVGSNLDRDPELVGQGCATDAVARDVAHDHVHPAVGAVERVVPVAADDLLDGRGAVVRGERRASPPPASPPGGALAGARTRPCGSAPAG